MASTRINAQKRRAPRVAPRQTPRQALAALARDAAHIQIAACTATANTLVEWARATDRFAQAAADELLRRVDGETDSAEMLARVTAAGDVHLRELSTLPRAAANHFDARLARAAINHEELR
jgi:hypothetical protein